MPGDLVTLDLGAVLRERAAIERDRIAAVLAAIEELRLADLAVKDDTLSEAGEYLAMKRWEDAEEQLLTLITDPGFARYHRHLLKGLTDFAVGGVA